MLLYKFMIVCLLSPQTIAQQIQHSLDCFHANGSFSSSRFTETIYNNNKNNLPIFFTSSDLSSTPTTKYSTSNKHCLKFELPRYFTREHTLSNLAKVTFEASKAGSPYTLTRPRSNGLFGCHLKSIAHYKPLSCKACVHGKQHKWGIKSAALQHIESSHRYPGDCVSGDQLESTQPRLIHV